MEIDRKLAQKVLETVDAGLCSGLGKPEPGFMCVEAAVCYAMGLPHGDDPSCVAPALRKFKIGLNGAAWSSKSSRAKGMRRLALAQLGSAGILNEIEFVFRLAKQAKIWAADNAAAAADAAAYAADAAAAVYAARAADNAAALAAAHAALAAAHAAAHAAVYDAAVYAAADKTLAKYAEDVVQILIEMNAPGCQYLDLAPL